MVALMTGPWRTNGTAELANPAMKYDGFVYL